MKARPFNSIDELLITWKNKFRAMQTYRLTYPDIWVRFKEAVNIQTRIDGFDTVNKKIHAMGSWVSLTEACVLLEFLDGNPFGILI